MSINMNRVTLAGNLTRDPQIGKTPEGTSAVDFGLALNRKYKKNDQLVEDTCFVDCVSYGKNADTIGKHFTKGRNIFIDGRLKLQTWKDKDGNNRNKIKVVVENFQFVDYKKDDDKGKSKGFVFEDVSTAGFDSIE
ncbi:MAG: single-stranded DNA-binding protein [Clostridiales bacterium]|nr:single-stranded DNA-binding protein [Clostridiales bacterium]